VRCEDGGRMFFFYLRNWTGGERMGNEKQLEV
jgi:hypothetical protein